MEKEILEPGYCYHIYNRGNNKEDIFIEEKNYIYFLSLIQKYILPIADIYGYCLLKNHFHLIIRIKEAEQLPEQFRGKIHQPFSNMFNSYTKSINKVYNRSGSLFQEHLQRIRIDTENYLKQLVAYVHLNPVKHKFTSDFKSYRYSSYQAYLSEKLSNLERGYILELFEDKENFKAFHNESKIKYEGVIKDIDEMDY